VDAFIERKIGFTDIWGVVAQTMEDHQLASASSLESLIAADSWARERALSVYA
jgi:1-deoxy-D-xylulose-5-phosphate reductoisomerase